MATKAARELGEARLNALDLDDDGEFDVESYPLELSADIADDGLREAWQEALAIVHADDDDKEPTL